MKRDEFIKTMTGWVGAVRGDAVHKQIVDGYNSFLPHPRGYKLTYSDDYCAATRARKSKRCRNFSMPVGTSWTQTVHSDPRRRRRGESTSRHTFSRS